MEIKGGIPGRVVLPNGSKGQWAKGHRTRVLVRGVAQARGNIF